MRRHWKRLAKSASNAACDDRETTETLTGALKGDWRAEVPEAFVGHLRNIIDDRQGALFGESAIEQIQALRGKAADSPLAGAVLDCVSQALHEGYRGDEALARAAGDALLERACSVGRQVEEHWLRESSARSATLVRNRIDGAIAAANMSDLAKRCIGCADAAAPRGPTKKTGIDDGVSLP